MIDLDYDSDSITYITNLHETGIQGSSSYEILLGVPMIPTLRVPVHWAFILSRKGGYNIG